jgi:two-component system, cell cycle sensor histidine kinase and response regulator CckA
MDDPRADREQELALGGLQAVFDANIIGIAISGADQRILAANDSYLEAVGFTREDLEAGRVDWRSVTPPEFAASDEAALEEFARSGVFPPFEKAYVHADGRHVPVVLASAAIPGTGGMATFVLDISAQKGAEEALRRSEERYRELFDAAIDATFVIDRQTLRLIDANRMATSLYGYSRDELLAMRPQDISLEPEATEAFLRSVVSGPGDEPQPGERMHRRKDGSQFPVEFSARRLSRDSRDVLLISCRDLTERRAAEAALRQAQAAVDQAQRAEVVGRLAGGIAHDFNNLLTAIGGHAEFLLASLDIDDPRRSDIAPILDASARAADLTRQLLAFGRREVLHPTVVVPGDVVERLRPMLRSIVPADVDLVFSPDPGRAPVRVDRDRLGNAVINLVLNARDAMPAGGTLTVGTEALQLEAGDCRLRPPAAPGAFVRLWVADTGTGIPADLLPHIFEPFFTTKRLGRGSGLGLPSVDGFVAQSGGWVTVDTDPGVGSVFSLYLAAEAQPASGAPASAPVGEVERSPRRTVLVVDDEPEVRAITGRLLRQLGYDVVEAADGEEAISAWSRDHIDVLVSDVVLPGLSGPELAARCRAHRPGLPVLLVSGYARESLVSDGRAIEGSSFLAKPFTKDQLALRLRELLEPPA